MPDPAPAMAPKPGKKGKGIKFFLIYVAMEIVQQGAKKLYNHFFAATTTTTTVTPIDDLLDRAKHLLNPRGKRSIGKSSSKRERK
jgi:hypothetical protein